MTVAGRVTSVTGQGGFYMLYPSLLTVSLCLLSILISSFFMFGRKKWDPRRKVSVKRQLLHRLNLSSLQHCYVTGGSSGTGLCLAIMLAEKGSHVSIVARDENKLKDALQKLEVQ